MVNLSELELGSVYRMLLLPLRYPVYSVQSFLAVNCHFRNFGEFPIISIFFFIVSVRYTFCCLPRACYRRLPRPTRTNGPQKKPMGAYRCNESFFIAENSRERPAEVAAVDVRFLGYAMTEWGPREPPQPPTRASVYPLASSNSFLHVYRILA